MVIGRVCLDGGGAGERACPLRASPQSESAADSGPMARRVAGDHPAHAQAKTFENSTSLVRTHCGPLRSRPLARLAVRDIDDLSCSGWPSGSRKVPSRCTGSCARL
jgi:hypothetical protein